MDKIEFTVHEFMAIMGMLDERAGDSGIDDMSVYHLWFDRYQQLDKRLESLPMMERADMLFDGKVAINSITEPHLREVLEVVRDQVQIEQGLINEGAEDGDPEEVEIWQTLALRLEATLESDAWS